MLNTFFSIFSGFSIFPHFSSLCTKISRRDCKIKLFHKITHTSEHLQYRTIVVPSIYTRRPSSVTIGASTAFPVIEFLTFMRHKINRRPSFDFVWVGAVESHSCHKIPLFYICKGVFSLTFTDHHLSLHRQVLFINELQKLQSRQFWLWWEWKRHTFLRHSPIIRYSRNCFSPCLQMWDQQCLAITYDSFSIHSHPPWYQCKPPPERRGRRSGSDENSLEKASFVSYFRLSSLCCKHYSQTCNWWRGYKV